MYLGKVDSLEVDFVAEKGNEVIYYQVAATVREESTLKKELLSLEKIRDNNSKYLITLDETPIKSHNGIKQINAYDFLLGNY